MDVDDCRGTPARTGGARCGNVPSPACAGMRGRANGRGRRWFQSDPGRHPARRSSGNGAAVPQAGVGFRAGLPGGRAGHRAVRAGADRRSADHPARGRTGRGDVPVRDRTGDESLASVEPARADLRPGQRADPDLRCLAHLRGIGVRFPAGGVLCLRDGLRADLHGYRDAIARRARRHRRAARAEDGLGAAVRGPADRAAAGHRGLPGAARR